jgi:hypothetical protein
LLSTQEVACTQTVATGYRQAPVVGAQALTAHTPLDVLQPETQQMPPRHKPLEHCWLPAHALPGGPTHTPVLVLQTKPDVQSVSRVHVVAHDAPAQAR